MFGNIGFWDLIIVLVIFLILFGGKKLPELAMSLGKALSIFKKGIEEGKKNFDSMTNIDSNENPDASVSNKKEEK